MNSHPVLFTLVGIYLSVGLGYASRSILKGYEPLYVFPINVLAGPAMLLYLGYLKVFKIKKAASQKRTGINIKARKAIIFDLDGTIVNSEPLWRQALENVRNTLGTFSLDNYYEVGLSNVEIWKRVLKSVVFDKKYTAEELSQKTTEAFLTLLNKSESILTEGFFQIAADLKVDKNLVFVLTTNSHRSVVDAVLAKEGIAHLFDLVLTGDDIKKPKPNPEIYNTALKKLKLKPQEALVFEDSVNGTKAAIASNIDTVVVWRDKENKFKYPTTVLGYITDFRDIVQVLVSQQSETQSSQA